MKVIHNKKTTVFPGVPATYIGIINHPDVSKYDLRSVKACISGSVPLPMEVQVKFGEITGGQLVEGYGLTEAAPVTHCNPIYGTRKAGSIGVPLPMWRPRSWITTNWSRNPRAKKASCGSRGRRSCRLLGHAR